MIVAIGDSAIHKSFLAGPRHGLESLLDFESDGLISADKVAN